MAEKLNYSKYLNTITALVSHLAITNHKSRTPKNLAKFLSLDPEEVLFVLENFKGLFRKSLKKSTKSGEYYYTLQLRYARRYLDENSNQEFDEAENEDKINKALEPEYLTSLLTFISNMVSQEMETNRTRITSWVAFGASVIALISAFGASVIALIGAFIAAFIA